MLYSAMKKPMIVREATQDDVLTLQVLIPASVRALSRDVYSPAQIESAIRFVFGVDTQLIQDRTYFVAVSDNTVVGCGGWSRRQTLYGGDQMKFREDPMLDPAIDAARIRAFFVHPDWARQGIGSRILAACVDGARAAGFSRLELVATLPGEPLYRGLGFEVMQRFDDVLPDGVRIPFVRMSRRVPERCGE